MRFALSLLVICPLASAEPAQLQLAELLARQKQLEEQLQVLQRALASRETRSERRLALYNEASEASILAQLDTMQDSNARQVMKDTLKDLVGKFGTVSTCLDYLWLLVCGSLVMFMQAGFAILESGACRAKNGGMVLTKNIVDVCVGTLAWYVVGYGLAYGLSTEPNEFVGTQNFIGSEFMITDADGAITGSDHFKNWFFQWAFCATAATIVSGAVAERIQFAAYVVYSIVMTGLIYPVVVYWTWSGSGFLTAWGYSDFAGSGIVHLTGGIGALVGATLIGSRKGRWNSADVHRFDPHSMPLVVLGTFVLWFGWYGFNCGSTLSFSDVRAANQAALVAMNTTVAAAVGGLTLFVLRLRTEKYDLAGACNGILVGLVAVCASVGDIEPGMAIILGVAGGFAHEVGSTALKFFKIDDPLDAFAVHGCGGITGVLLRPLLDRTGPKVDMFGTHCLAILIIAGWSGGLSVITFGILKAAGKLRVDEAEEEEGTDMVLSQQLYRYATQTALGKVEAVEDDETFCV